MTGEPVSEKRIATAIRDAPQTVVNTRYLVRELDVPSRVLVERLEAMAADGSIEHLEIEDRLDLWWLP